MTQSIRIRFLAVLPLACAAALVAPSLLAQDTQRAPAPAAPAPQTAQPASGPAANPFPEAESEAAAKAAENADKNASAGPAPDSSAPGDSDATEPSSSSRSRMNGLDLLGDNDSRTSDGAGHTIVNPKLGADDVKVGQLYLAEGDYTGAYARFKEATQVAPENADAIFYLAEAARKTAHLDEAASNYKLYLSAEPKGKRAKDAKKALVELAGK